MVPSLSACRAATLFAAFLLLPLAACQGTALIVGQAAPAEPVEEIESPSVSIKPFARARVRPGVYAGDDRFGALAATWDARVAAATELLERHAGLGFEASEIVVILAPLGDETQRWRIRTEMADGRRRPIVTIGAEGLVSGMRDPDRTLGRALADARFEVTSLTHGPVPAWVPELAGVITVADEAQELAAIHRALVMGDSRAAWVDTEADRAARATGLAVRYLLEDRGELGSVQRLLSFTADGDDPTWMLTRLLKEPDASWIGPAREALARRLQPLDPAPWQTLVRAREALATTGRGGLVAVVPAPVPEPIRGEIKWLLAKAAALEGDWASARRTLDAIPHSELVALEDPAAALAMYVDVESRPDGDPEKVQYWAHRLDLDFPKSNAREVLLTRRPTLGLDADPVRWLARMRRRIDAVGTEDLDLGAIDRVVRVLLADHRGGAAVRFLELIGDRAKAPELARAVEAVRYAQDEPTVASREINAERVAAWFDTPTRRGWNDVVDGGRAAFDSILERLPEADDPFRPRALRLLVETGGVTTSAPALAARWRRGGGTVAQDLDALAAGGDVFDVRDAIRGLVPTYLSDAQAASAWWRVSFLLPDTWVDAHPQILRDLRARSYPVRRAAFDQIADAGETTPELVGFALKDPAALLRQRAVEEAGELGYLSLAREALGDPAVPVRVAAVLAYAEGAGEQAVPRLLELVAADPAPEVRIASADGLLRVDDETGPVLDALVRTQVDPSAIVRDAVGTRLQAVNPSRLARALARQLRVEAARRELRRPVIVRLVVLFQRVSNTDLGYAPDSDRQQLQAMAKEMDVFAEMSAGLVPVLDEGDRRSR